MYGFYGMPFLYDTTYIFVIIGVILTLLAQFRLQSTYSKYSKIHAGANMTGAMVARRILDSNGLYDVKVNHVRGNLTDHYNPADKSVNLSDSIYSATSIAAISVAAHECGHAIQHKVGYAPLNFRTALFPVANFGSTLAIPMVILGLILGSMGNIMIQIGIMGNIVIQIGIILFLFAVLFQIVTLPVEFNASSRAIKQLDDSGLISMDEEAGAKRVLFAAALTYVAAAASSILQLIRLLVLAGGRNRD